MWCEQNLNGLGRTCCVFGHWGASGLDMRWTGDYIARGVMTEAGARKLAVERLSCGSVAARRAEVLIAEWKNLAETSV